jgi:bacterioferritin-associated ferredoxin
MSARNENTKISVEMRGRDRIDVEWDADDSGPPKVRFYGCSELLDLMKTMRQNFGADLRAWPVPSGASHCEMLVRELVLKLKGEWQPIAKYAEICHCRKVSAATIDAAILAGAHTPQMVSRQTSASTACGTCRPEVQQMIDHRLHAGLPDEARSAGDPALTPLKKVS